MSGRVCLGDGKANTAMDSEIAIPPEDMEKAIDLGVVPDELVEAGNLFVAHEELRHFGCEDANFMSPGLTAWRAIAFALERDLPQPQWVKQYLTETARALEDWSSFNGHPSKLKEILRLHGRRIEPDVVNDPRWIFEAVCQLRVLQPEATVKDLVSEYTRRFPTATGDFEALRQKYYQGKRLAEKSQDYKGRDRKSELLFHPYIAPDSPDDEIEF